MHACTLQLISSSYAGCMDFDANQFCIAACSFPTALQSVDFDDLGSLLGDINAYTVTWLHETTGGH